MECWSRKKYSKHSATSTWGTTAVERYVKIEVHTSTIENSLNAWFLARDHIKENSKKIWDPHSRCRRDEQMKYALLTSIQTILCVCVCIHGSVCMYNVHIKYSLYSIITFVVISTRCSAVNTHMSFLLYFYFCVDLTLSMLQGERWDSEFVLASYQWKTFTL